MTEHDPELIKAGSAKVVWDVADAEPVLFARLLQDAPWVAAELVRFRAAPPVASTCEPFTTGDYFRPPLHLRCFYRRGPAGDVIPIKGTEVLAGDVVATMEGLRTARHKATLLSGLEHLPVREHKVPWALLRREAHSEATAAAQLQSAHFRRYGTLVRAPFPLLIYAWPQQVAEQHCERLRGLVSDYAAEIIQRLVADGGLATYLYYYPGMPFRWRDIEVRLGSVRSMSGYDKRWTELGKHLDPHVAITGWTHTLVRILGLGYFPCVLSQLASGNCLQPQNVALDGGLFDVDSLQPFDKVLDEREFRETLFTSLIFFTQTLQSVLQQNFFDPNDLGIGVNFTMIFARLWEELKRLAAEERRDGTVFDARLEQLWNGTGSFVDDLQATFTALYPPSFSLHVGNARGAGKTP